MARRNRGRAEGNVFRLDAARRLQASAAAEAVADTAEDSDGLSIALFAGPPLAREMIVHWLQQVASPCRVALFDNPAAFRAQQQAEGPFDLLLLGHCLQTAPAGHLLDTVRALRDDAVPLVVVSGSEDARTVAEALRCGVRGYIPTHLPVPVAVAALKLVLSGGLYAPPLLAAEDPVATRAPTLDSTPLPLDSLQRLRLSRRESQVLRLLRVGCSNRQIAAELDISENTVMVHVRHLLRKLGVTNRTQAVYKAAQLLGADGAAEIAAPK